MNWELISLSLSLCEPRKNRFIFDFQSYFVATQHSLYKHTSAFAASKFGILLNLHYLCTRFL